MLEKNGSIKLTEEDLLLVKQGSVPDRVASTWDVTSEQLQEVVKTNDYVLIDSIKPKKENT
jgi:hypothetical protein